MENIIFCDFIWIYYALYSILFTSPFFLFQYLSNVFITFLMHRLRWCMKHLIMALASFAIFNFLNSIIMLAYSGIHIVLSIVKLYIYFYDSHIKIRFNYLNIKDDVNIQNGVLRRFPCENLKSGNIEEFSSCSLYVLFYFENLYAKKL